MSSHLHAPAPLPPGERASDTHWIGGWVGSIAGVDNVEKEISSLYRDSNSEPSVVQPVASVYTDYAIPGYYFR
jgi:hypothetical protein